jgi:hypothetical protein
MVAGNPFRDLSTEELSARLLAARSSTAVSARDGLVELELPPLSGQILPVRWSNG